MSNLGEGNGNPLIFLFGEFHGQRSLEVTVHGVAITLQFQNEPRTLLSAKELPQLSPTLWDPVYCNAPGSPVHRILQAIIVEWVVMPFSRGSSWPRDQTLDFPALAGGVFITSIIKWSSVQFSSVTQSYLTLGNPMDCSTPGFPVHYQLPGLTQSRVQRVCYAIQPSHPLLSPSPTTFNLSQHQDLFQWISSSDQVAKVLEFQLQHQAFQWIFRTDFL